MLYDSPWELKSLTTRFQNRGTPSRLFEADRRANGGASLAHSSSRRRLVFAGGAPTALLRRYRRPPRTLASVRCPSRRGGAPEGGRGGNIYFICKKLINERGRRGRGGGGEFLIPCTNSREGRRGARSQGVPGEGGGLWVASGVLGRECLGEVI